MRHSLIALLALLCSGTSSAEGYVDTLSVLAGGGGGGACSGSHCSPGTQALTFNAATDSAFADTGASVGQGHFTCTYFRFTGAPGAVHQVVTTLRTAGSEVYSFWPHADGGSWPSTAFVGLFRGSTQPGSGYVGQTTNIYAQCLLATDGTGETAGARTWLFEETAADTWTERDEASIAGAIGTVSDAEWLIGNGLDSVAPNPVEILYSWVVNNDFGINYDAAGAQTEIEKYLGCSIDPAGTNVDHSWPMVDASTSSEPDGATGGTALSLTSITRTSRSAIWTAGGSGEAALCDL